MKFHPLTFRIITSVVVAITSVLLPDFVLAVQTHRGAEGIVSHEIGHFLFVIGMGYLLFRVYRMGMTGPGWFEFKGFLWLIIAWNCLTFSGHWLDEVIDPRKFIKEAGRTQFFTITSFSDAYFYLTKLDHLILVPSFILLFLALRQWRQPQ